MTEAMRTDTFNYSDERFADLQLLRYRLNGFEDLTLRQKEYIYYLSEATLCGRDITFDQFGKYNLRVRKTLEAVYTGYRPSGKEEEAKELEVYLKRVWFSNGIYHHYGCEKFVPGFSPEFLHEAMMSVDKRALPLDEGESVQQLYDELRPVIFEPEVLPKRVNKACGEDLVATSACNYYENVTQAEAEAFYGAMNNPADSCPPSYGLNSKLVKEGGELRELTYKADGMYGSAIRRIVYWLEKAKAVAETASQQKVIERLIRFYNTGSLRDFDEYSIEWVNDNSGRVDFINGFIEVYGDPLGLKASWEGIVEYKDLKATERARAISDNAQWFEDNSPVDPRFRKPVVKGVTASVICAAMLGGDEYPSTAIGINLPNADWIRAEYGSKSVTISNLTEAYKKAAHGNGFNEEFVIDREALAMIDRYGDLCDDLHTDLHECLGHGSGRLMPGVSPDALKAYGNTIEEARADLFGLYYIADSKLVEMGILPDTEAYKSHYYTYMMNGLLTQLTRIKPGHSIEEAHMRNRALIARWCLKHGSDGNVVELVVRDGKTYVAVNDYARLRGLFAALLAEVQRIKSEGDYDAARELVEKYAIKVDTALHGEVLARYEKLGLAPYKGFINPVMRPVMDDKGELCDIIIDYTEGYAEQMLRYSREYATLI